MELRHINCFHCLHYTHCLHCIHCLDCFHRLHCLHCFHSCHNVILLHGFTNGLQSKRGSAGWMNGWMDGWRNTHQTVLYQSTCGANKIINRRENPVGKRAALPGPQVVFHLTKCQILLKDLAGCICKKFDTSHNAQKKEYFILMVRCIVFQITSYKRQNLILFRI